MPNYVFQCDKCQHSFERQLLIADRRTPEGEPCPECHQTGVEMQIYAPPVVDSWRIGVKKVPAGFKDVLKHIKSRNHGSTIEV
jgi:putative FmdB family regulatory protein